MRYLLDSHIILWALTDYEMLPERVRSIISDQSNDIHYSLASLWEITIKWINNPLKVPISGAEMARGCEMDGYRFLPISQSHVNDLVHLSKRAVAPRHADPFDRILICQARVEQMTFITHDRLLQYYDEPCIMTV